jgi:hypothetical protein
LRTPGDWPVRLCKGFAGTENTTALNSYRELFALKKNLEGRLKDQGKGLSAEEKRGVDGLISQANQAALRNVDAWSMMRTQAQTLNDTATLSYA